MSPRRGREVSSFDKASLARIFQHAYNRGFARGYARVVRREARALLANAWLQGLAARDMPETERQRLRILGCRSVVTLDQWLDRACTVGAVARIFRPDPEPGALAPAVVNA